MALQTGIGAFFSARGARRHGRNGPLLALWSIVAAFGAAGLGPIAGPAGAAPAPGGAGLTAFRSDAELRNFLTRMEAPKPVPPPPPPPPPPAPPSPSAPPSAGAVQSTPMAEMDASDAIVTTGSRVASPNITNRQEADVDEGGIVKVRGEILVILRRGRLFTVSLAGGRMRPVDSIDAFPPGVSGQGDWYDEMLLSGDRVVVIGYSYDRGGTEVNRFRLGRDGRLRFEDAYHLRSNDYYSSRNYASRLIGDRLILYSPLDLEWEDDPLEALPGIRRWRSGNEDEPFRRIAPARQVYIAPILHRARDVSIDTLHSVTTCNLTAPVLDCSATAVLGPESRTFYVSGHAVYVWVANEDAFDDGLPRRVAPAAIYRLPLDRGRPSSVGARGAPVDQFSFREDAAAGVLNVLVRSEGGGDAMLQPEFSEGAVALLRAPLGRFGDGSRELPRSRYRLMPKPGEGWSFQNRFVGNYVLYGADAGDGRRGRRSGRIVVAPLTGGPIEQLPLAQQVGRIEALGADALVVGSSGADLGFTTVELTGRSPRLGDRYVLPASSEGETRSHAFFFSPGPNSPDGASGLLGLPVARPAEPRFSQLFGSSAAMLFLRREQRRLSRAGELAAGTAGIADDNCKASCVDWYGNARPIFLGGRVFALLGYELVEGSFDGMRIREIARTSFAPQPRRRDD